MQWHKGLGPMALANCDLDDLEAQTWNQQFKEWCNTNMLWMVEQQKKFDTTPSPLPTNLNSFLILLQRYCAVLHRLFGDMCSLEIQVCTLITMLASQQDQYACNPLFLLHWVPNILWEVMYHANHSFPRHVLHHPLIWWTETCYLPQLLHVHLIFTP